MTTTAKPPDGREGLGRENPTLFLSNNFDVTPRELITNYARRNGVEDALGSSVNFFHLDCLSSEVRLNVDLDTVLTVIANGCYRWLANQLHGFARRPSRNSLYRKFVETAGTVKIKAAVGSSSLWTAAAITRSCEKPNLDVPTRKIPWLADTERRIRLTLRPESAVLLIELRGRGNRR